MKTTALASRAASAAGSRTSSLLPHPAPYGARLAGSIRSGEPSSVSCRVKDVVASASPGPLRGSARRVY